MALPIDAMWPFVGITGRSHRHNMSGFVTPVPPRNLIDVGRHFEVIFYPFAIHEIAGVVGYIPRQCTHIPVMPPGIHIGGGISR
jgi:hypothetical protein